MPEVIEVADEAIKTQCPMWSRRHKKTMPEKNKSEMGDMEKTKLELLEMKNQVLEMKNILTGINTRLGTKLTERTIRNETKTGVRGKGINSISDLWDNNNKQFNLT